MAETSIGIKIADGSFYPVLAENAPGHKRVILTTVTDNQSGAQIDLYRGNGTGIAGATYIGSLLIDEIERGPKGEPEIELLMRLDAEGNLEAQASDRVTGEHQTLSVGLATLVGAHGYTLPDFDLDERYQPRLGVSPAEQTRLTAEPVSPDFSRVEADVQRRRRRRTLEYIGVAVLAAVIIAIIVLLVLWFTHRANPRSQAAAVTATSTRISSTPAAGSSQTAAGAAAAHPAKAQSASHGTSTPASSVAQPGRPAKTQYREGGVMYQIRWGDTLWDLSISFYRTPWLYGKIAKANNIKNPNLIFANTVIYIPER